MPKQKTTAQKLREEADRLNQRAVRLEALGQDEWPEETVLFFQKQFRQFNTVYAFVALKIAGSWWLSGNGLGYRGRTWSELVDFIMLDNYVDPIEVWTVSEWQKVN